MHAAGKGNPKTEWSFADKKEQSDRMRRYFAKHPEKVTRLYGKDNPAYKNGEARERKYVDFTETLKEKVRQRDGNICQICWKNWEDGPRFDVHHVDYNKKNFDEKNLVTLCKSCHAKTHYHREEWQGRFELG